MCAGERSRRSDRVGIRAPTPTGRWRRRATIRSVVLSYGLAPLPGIFNRTSGRRRVQELTGNRWVPTLLLDDGTVIDGSHEIMDWARANPA